MALMTVLWRRGSILFVSALLKSIMRLAMLSEAFWRARPHAAKWKENSVNSRACQMLSEAKVQQRLEELHRTTDPSSLFVGQDFFDRRRSRAACRP